MTRIFLKLYFLLVFPLLIMALLPTNPLSMVGNWWIEKEAYRQYGAVYPLVKEELDKIPQSEWINKVKDIGEQFAYPLLLKPRDETKYKDETYAKLDGKGYALVSFNGNRTLIFAVDKTDFILYASLSNKVSSDDLFEKQTRGFRYFLDKKIKESDEPLKEFERLKKLFTVKLEMVTFEEFKTGKSDELLEELSAERFYLDYKKNNKSYLLSDDKKYVLSITGNNSNKDFNRYYNYLSYIIPALLLAIGVLVWIYLFRKEFRVLNKTAKAFGNGKLDERIELSKNSALYPIAGSFNDMASRIQALLDGHKELTNAVSHELKTPLSRLNFALEMQKSSTSKEEKDLYTDKIEQNILALENLVDELLSYARLQRQQTTLVPQSLKSWLEKEVSAFIEYHPQVKVLTDIQVQQDVSFDAHLMTRVLNNLINNAVEYSTSKAQIIKISAKLNQDTIYLAVEDNGIGVKPEDCEKIFEPFTRLDKSRQKKSTQNMDGYGMGLSIVKSIMQQHNGDVVCKQSELGGAKFCLTWPFK